MVISKITKQTMEFLAPVYSMSKKLGLFDFLKLLYQKGFEFARKHPQAVQLGRDILLSKTLEKEKLLKSITEEAFTLLHINSHNFYMELIRDSLARGEITDTYSPVTINVYIQTIMESISKQLILSNISDPYGDEAEQVLNEYISIMRHGLCKQTKKQQGGKKTNGRSKKCVSFLQKE